MYRGLGFEAVPPECFTFENVGTSLCQRDTIIVVRVLLLQASLKQIEYPYVSLLSRYIRNTW